MKLPGNTKEPILILRKFEIIKEITSLLEPLGSATHEMSSEKYVPLSKIILITNCRARNSKYNNLFNTKFKKQID